MNDYHFGLVHPSTGILWLQVNDEPNQPFSSLHDDDTQQFY
jgi:hypothetical protein